MRFPLGMPGAGAFASLMLALAMAPAVLRAQEAPGDGPLRVFLDCQTFCDQTYIRTEITWVDWVRDREDAGVHVLVTGEGTGGGGRRFVLAFLGRGPHEGDDHEMAFTSSGDATQDEVRAGVTRVLALGLVSYARGTTAQQRLSVTYAAPDTGQAEAEPTDDPWNYWVFRLGLNGNLNGESRQRFSNWRGSLNANRTTEAWKISVSGSFSRDASEYELEESTNEFVTETWETNTLVVKSLGPHWSAGLRASMGSSTYFNHDFRWGVHPGVEYNLFPYAETSRRELTLQYLVGVDFWDYEEETIYEETSERRASHSITLGLDFTQPWGQSNISVRGKQYFHDTSKYSLSVGGNTDIRLFRGFSLNVGGNYSRVRDQLGIRKGNADDEEILTRQRELATNYRYFLFFGVSYRFGSIFNNVVNPRFGNTGFFF